LGERVRVRGIKEIAMGFVDVVLMIVIVCGAVYLLYRSIWKKKGHCSGCDSGICDMKKKNNSKGC
jgi:hypothetical protein